MLDDGYGRVNTSDGALGKLRRLRVHGSSFYLSPDCYVLTIPTSLTWGLSLSTMYLVWDMISTLELLVVVVLLGSAFASSLAVVSTDPGVYPRLNEGETDPLEGRTDLIQCRLCNVRRPPRTSHCYICGVCVREHDHHCGILGGCVGIRSLRWFLIYLISTSTATLFGLIWLIRYSIYNSFRSVRKQSRTEFIGNRRKSPLDGEQDTNPLAIVGTLTLLIVELVVLMLVGSMAAYYVFLATTGHLRREVQKKRQPANPEAGIAAAQAVPPVQSCSGTLAHIFRPPASLLELRSRVEVEKDEFIV